MNPGAHALSRALLAWAAATIVACAVVHGVYSLDVDEAHPRAIVASVWQKGELIARAVLAPGADDEDRLRAALASHPGATLVHENIVGEGPVAAFSEATLAVSFVAGRDGISGTLGGRTAYVTPDDLLARQAYDKGLALRGIQVTTGVDVPIALGLLSDRLGVSARDLVDRARVRRIRVVRTLPGAATAPSPTAPSAPSDADSLSASDAREAAIAMGAYLARGVDARGRFRYLVDAPTNRDLPGYDWPRHAGATYYLAEIAALSGDTAIAWATLRAASWLRDHAMVRCGEHRCIGEDNVVDVGSAALAILAFAEIARTKLDAGYGLLIPELAAFVRAQQRDDGELMHLYDRAAGRPIDTQLLYYSGEAAFALSRAHSLLGDPRDLAAAARALAHLVGGAWSFFGSRYYWGEEHWTCQAMDDLWDRAPNPTALAFCLGWAAYGRKLQYRAGETPFDAEGAYGLGPFLTPRLTPAGSRSEAGIATLEAARRAGVPEPELAPLELQMRRSLALLLRNQFRASRAFPSYLLANPEALDGAMPGSEVDWQLRIDYPQHAGGAMLRWLELASRVSAQRPPVAAPPP